MVGYAIVVAWLVPSFIFGKVNTVPYLGYSALTSPSQMRGTPKDTSLEMSSASNKSQIDGDDDTTTTPLVDVSGNIKKAPYYNGDVDKEMYFPVATVSEKPSFKFEDTTVKTAVPEPYISEKAPVDIARTAKQAAYEVADVSRKSLSAVGNTSADIIKGESGVRHEGMPCYRIDRGGAVVPDRGNRHPVSAAYQAVRMGRRTKLAPSDLLRTVMAQEAMEKPRMYGGSVVALNGDSITPKQNYSWSETREELSSRKRRQTDVDKHEVELLLVVDYPLYMFWLKRNSMVTTRAKDEIIDFYTNIIHAANKRYESMYSSIFQVKLLVNAFIIADTPNRTPWTQLLNDSNAIDTDMALDNFTLWIQRNMAHLPPHDHAITLSGFDLTRNGRPGLVGLAFQNGTCTKFSQSIIETLKTQETATLVAHEIAHSLGAAHDGQTNACSNDNKNVMSTSISIPDRNMASHPWMFSSCSQATIMEYIGRRTDGCTTRRSGSPQNMDMYVHVPFGQKYPADIQCEIYLGDRSKFCRSVYNHGGRVFDDMCHSLYCLNSTNNRCYPTLAHDGTTCGNKKWCQSGVCVVSQQAPSTPNECPAGDDPDARCARFDCRNPTIARTICCSTCTPPQTQRQATVPPQTTPFHRQYRQHPPLGQRFGRVFESPTFQLPPQRAIQPYPDRYSRRPSYSNSQPFQTRSPFQPSRQIQQRPYFQPTQPFQQRPRFTPNQPFRQRPPFNPSQPVGQRSSFGQYPPLQRTQRYRPPQAKPFQNMFTFPFQGNFDNSFNSFIQRFQRYSTFFKRK